jgi:hypothetical protein
MSFTAYLQHSLRVVEGDVHNAGGRIAVHRLDTLRVTNGLRHDAKLLTLSAGVSNTEVTLSPITASDPGALLRLTTDQPLDVRLNTSNASMLSAVHQLILGGSISALFLSVPGATAATVRVEVFGGGSIQASLPSP